MEEQKGLELDLKHIICVLLKKWWLILVVSVLCAAIMFAYTSLFVDDTYTVRAQMTVSNVVDAPNMEQIGMSSSDVLAATSLIETYCVILKNENSMNLILAESGLSGKYTAGQIKSMVSASGVGESLVLEILVTAPNGQDAQAIANAATKVLEMYDGLGASARAAYQVSAPNANNPDAKGETLKAIIGFLVGAVCTALILIILDLKNDSIHSDEWLKETFGESIPLLSVIPDANAGIESKDGKYKRYSYFATSDDGAKSPTGDA